MKKQMFLFTSLILLISCNKNNDDDTTVMPPVTAVSVTNNISETDTDFTDISFPSPSTGYISGNKTGGKSFIYKSIDGGATWNTKQTTMTGISNILFVNDNTGFATGQTFVTNFAPDFIKTVDGGANWTSLDVPVTSDERLDALFFLDTSTGYVAGQTGKIYKTINGGTSWNILFDSTAELKDIVFLNVNTGFAVGSKGTILKTTDAGVTWTTKISGDNNFISTIKFINTTTGLAVSSSGKILKTIDAGETWSTVFTSSKNLTSIAIVNNKILVGGSADFSINGNVILSSTDNGNNWVTQPLAVGPKGINGIHFFTDIKGLIVGGSSVNVIIL